MVDTVHLLLKANVKFIRAKMAPYIGSSFGLEASNDEVI